MAKSLTLHQIVVKNARIDLLQGRATITLEAPLSPEVLQARGLLSWWNAEAMDCTVNFVPDDAQPALLEPELPTADYGAEAQ